MISVENLGGELPPSTISYLFQVMVSKIQEFPSDNPNFPLNLDIYPSAIPISAHPKSRTDANQLDAAFGSAAQELAIRHYGIAGRVWEAAYAMTSYIDPPSNVEFDPPMFNASDLESSTGVSITELGSGSGLVASTLAKLLDLTRDHLIATDLPEVCKLLEANLQTVSPLSLSKPEHSVRGPGVTVLPVSWGSLEDILALALAFRDPSTNRLSFGSLTHIICSDLVYFPELLGPLLRCLLHLSAPPFVDLSTDIPAAHQRLTIFISYKIRSLAKETPFWSAFGIWFDFCPVLIRSKSEGAEWKRFGADFDDISFLFVAHRRPESYDWELPPTDQELLAGVGVYGTDTSKGDDTFENLLLMSLNQD